MANNNEANNFQTRDLVVVADNYTSNLRACGAALGKSYYLTTAPTVTRMLEIAHRQKPSLLIVSDAMTGMTEFEAVKQLRADDSTRHIPILVITDKLSEEKERRGLLSGVTDFVVKPISESLLNARVGSLIALSRKPGVYIPDGQIRHSRIEAVSDSLSEIIAELVEHRDDVEGRHIDRTLVYFRVFINAVVREGIYKEETAKWDIPVLINAAQLHDVGKCAIPDSVLLKPEKLTSAEFDIMKMHTIYGVELLEKVEKRIGSCEFLTHAKIIAGTHHEKWNGSGYPYGLKGGQIPLQGRIMAVVDVYDAFTTRRPYKTAYSHDEALKLIKLNRSAHFDPVLADLFLRMSDEFPDAVNKPDFIAEYI